MTPEQVTGPHDALEQAILDGQIWQSGEAPVKIDAFNPEEEVISILCNKDHTNIRWKLQKSGTHLQILANGMPVANLPNDLRSVTAGNLHILVSM